MTSHPDPALLVDLYQLTMVAAYEDEGIADTPASFSLFVRDLPQDWGYVVAAGLDAALSWLEDLRFEDRSLEALAGLGPFTDEQVARFADLTFTGAVRAVPEGTLVFAEEPLLEVDARLAEAQVVETMLLNQVTLHAGLATSAARCRHAAGARSVVDFALRRVPGVDAASALARAGRIVGLDGTSNVDGAVRFGLPAVGTMAHSYVQAHPDEVSAFRAFTRVFGDDSVLLVDTYDTPTGVDNAVAVALERRAEGGTISALRIDSGDLAALAEDARRRLDAAGLTEVRILVSGGLDERRVQDLCATDAPIDGFGVGTALGAGPRLDSVYKMVRIGDRDVHKTSEGKATWPGRKQVWRPPTGGADVLSLADEPAPGPDHRPLLAPVMEGGRRTPAGGRPLEEASARFREDLDRLPEEAKALTGAPLGAVEPSPRLRDTAKRLGGRER